MCDHQCPKYATLKPFRVLALDGGGIRGLYTATLLKILTEHFSKELGKTFDENIGAKFNLIAGTSTGGILATALAARKPLSGIISLYKEAGSDIFPKSHCLPNNTLNKIWWCFRFARKPAAKHEILKNRLMDLFGDMTLADIYNDSKVSLCIPCIDAVTQKSVVIKTPHAAYITRDGNRKAVDVCMATSAAPFYFPMAALPRTEVSGYDIFVDGGLWANNPVLVGLVEALDLAEKDQPIEIVSVGTCNPPEGQTLQPEDCHRGVFGWGAGATALTLSLEAQAFGHASIASKLSSHLRVACKIIRLPSSPPSYADSKHFGLDKAYKAALEVLQSKAVCDAKMIQSLHNKGDKDISALAQTLA